MPSKTSKNVNISVIIPTHNRPAYLENALRSVQSQTYKNFEVIVIDDGLKQRAYSTVQKFDDLDIIYIKNEKNIGGAASRNRGIAQAHGEHVAFLDDDDEWFPEKLQTQYRILKKYSDQIDFTFCRIQLKREETGEITRKSFQKEGIYNFYEDLIDHRLRIFTPSLLIKKETLKKNGGFDVSFPSSQEWELMIRVSKNSKGYVQNNILVHVTMLAGDHIGGNLLRRIRGREMLVEKHIDELKKRPKVLARHYFQLGLFCKDSRQFKKARCYFTKALALRPYFFRYLLHGLLSLAGGLGYVLAHKIKDS